MDPETFSFSDFAEQLSRAGGVAEVRSLLSSVPPSYSRQTAVKMVAEHVTCLEPALMEELLNEGAVTWLIRNRHLTQEGALWILQQLHGEWGTRQGNADYQEIAEVLLRRGFVPAGHRTAEKVRFLVEEFCPGSEGDRAQWGRGYLYLPEMTVERARAMLARFSVRWTILSGALPHLRRELQVALWMDWFAEDPEWAERSLPQYLELLDHLPQEVLGTLLRSEDSRLRVEVIRRLGKCEDPSEAKVTREGERRR